MSVTITSRVPGKTDSGEPVYEYLMSSDSLSLTLLNFGARLCSLKYLPAHKKPVETILGYSNWEAYLHDEDYLGALIGPVANRIGGAEFVLGEKNFQLDQNEYPNHLHGGKTAFHNQCWDVHIESDGLILSRLFKDGEGGYPGNRRVSVKVQIEDAILRLSYEATTDSDTVFSICHHPYFNFGEQETVLDHKLVIHADTFLPVAPGGLPADNPITVTGSAFDFRQGNTLRAGLARGEEQCAIAGGFDHCYALDAMPTGDLRPAAEISCDAAGVAMTLSTTAPGMQFYSGNGLTPKYKGLCLETQGWPDAVNHPTFPTVQLTAGETYRSMSVFKFKSLEAIS